MYSCYYDSPIGKLRICEENGAVTQLYLESHMDGKGEKRAVCLAEADMELASAEGAVAVDKASPVLKETCEQLSEYFAGERKSFQIPICPQGTDFQRKVWRALQDVPYGETRSYQDIAVAIDNPKAVRAVGQANHNNPILLIVPCHRVINKGGALGGFGCGLEVKKYLLALEKEACSGHR